MGTAGNKRSNGGKKKKGPKGKRARAKAKLERQWGEQVQTAPQLRNGKHRLPRRAVVAPLPPPPNTNGAPPTKKDDLVKTAPAATNNSAIATDTADNIVADLLGDESSDDADRVVAYNSLLDSIRQSDRRGKRRPPHEDERDGALSREDGRETKESDDNDDDSLCSAIMPSIGDDTTDTFADRFDRAFASGAALQAHMATVHATTKIVVPKVDSHLDWHVSSPWRQAHSGDDMPWSVWRQLAARAMASQVPLLRRTWKEQSIKLARQHQGLLPFMTSYMDMLITTNDSIGTRRDMVALASLHIMQHVLHSRSLVQKYNRHLAQAMPEQNNDSADRFRDQGFTRPTVLILAPTRAVAHDVIASLLERVGGSDRADNTERFAQEYGPMVPAAALAGADPTTATTNPPAETAAQRQRRQAVLAQKDADWQELFGDTVNDDDDFKIGMAIVQEKATARKKNVSSKKAVAIDQACSVKLYTDFYKSDIVVASPLAIKLAADNDDNDVDDDKDNSSSGADFLSSIEICLILRADVLLMQNWDHVNDVMHLINRPPQRTEHTDFARVRPYFLDGHASHWRQLIVSAAWIDPVMVSLFKRFAQSHSGVVKLRRRVAAEHASIARVLLPVRQVFVRVPCSTVALQTERKLDYFREHVLPTLVSSTSSSTGQNKQKHTLIFVPSYFDFVSLRNFLLQREVSFVSVTEYARVSEVSRGRARFLQGRKPIMLYTGRAHFFHRHHIKGARHVIFYGVPEHATFFAEHVNSLNQGLHDDDDSAASCLVLYTQYDAHALERVVGTEHCRNMIANEQSTFMFVS